MKKKGYILPYVLVVIFVITSLFTVGLVFCNIYERKTNDYVEKMKTVVKDDDLNKIVMW